MIAFTETLSREISSGSKIFLLGPPKPRILINLYFLVVK